MLLFFFLFWLEESVRFLLNHFVFQIIPLVLTVALCSFLMNLNKCTFITGGLILHIFAIVETKILINMDSICSDHACGAVKALPNPPRDFEWHRKFCYRSGPDIERIATGADFLRRCSSSDGWDNVSEARGIHLQKPDTNADTGLSQFPLTGCPCCSVNSHLLPNIRYCSGQEAASACLSEEKSTTA